MKLNKIITIILLSSVLAGCQGAGTGESTAAADTAAQAATAAAPVEADYSKGIAKSGFVEGVKDAGTLVEPVDTDTMTREKIGASVSDEDVDSAINDMLTGSMSFSTDRSVAAKAGDNVVIDYEALCEGKGFEGSSTNGEGRDLTVGYGELGSEIDQALTDMHPGQSKDVTFTAGDVFPEVSGKEVTCKVTLKGIYVVPELTDESAKRLVNGCTGVQDLKARVRAQLEKEKDRDCIRTYILENAKLRDGAEEELEDYILAMEDVFRSMDMSLYEAVSEAAPGLYPTFEDYLGEGAATYDQDTRDRAVRQAAYDLTMQDIFVKKGMKITNSDKLAFMSENDLTKEQRDYYGNYLMQMLLQEKVLDALAQGLS